MLGSFKFRVPLFVRNSLYALLECQDIPHYFPHSKSIDCSQMAGIGDQQVFHEMAEANENKPDEIVLNQRNNLAI